MKGAREEVVTVREFSTHLLHWGEPRIGQPLLVVVPGNPGSALFYTSFAACLASTLDAAVCVIGHAGHFAAPGLRDDAYAGLHGQVAHKAAVLTELMTRYGVGTRFVVLAHSIGSWIALQLRYERPDLPIERVVHLMPTLRHLYEGMTPFVRVAIHPWATHAVATLVHYCPVWLRDALVWFAGHDTDEIKLVVTDHLDFYTVRNTLQMAREEALHVREMAREHVDELRANQHMHAFVFSRIDHYVPLSYVDDLKRLVGGGLDIVVCEPHVEHAFVLRHASEVADVVAPLVRGFMVARTINCE